jgi:hypothetical protein
MARQRFAIAATDRESAIDEETIERRVDRWQVRHGWLRFLGQISSPLAEAIRLDRKREYPVLARIDAAREFFDWIFARNGHRQ